MESSPQSKNNVPATAALVVVITIVMVGLYATTDMNMFLRIGIALLSGLVAAGIVTAVLNRRRHT